MLIVLCYFVGQNSKNYRKFFTISIIVAKFSILQNILLMRKSCKNNFAYIIAFRLLIEGVVSSIATISGGYRTVTKVE